MHTANDDLKHIRSMMERSSTFVSLSGLSGVGAGVIALIGCGMAFYILVENGIDYFDGKPNFYPRSVLMQLGLLATFTFLLSIVLAIFFTMRKSRKLNVPLWSKTTQHILIAMLVPLVVGGLLCLILVSHVLFYLVAPCMLIFYGLALVSASKYTHRELFWLGILELTLGLLTAWFVGYGLVFWGIGFGLLHIIYGTLMYKKYQ